MWSKTYFLIVLVFFLVMNALLWRSHYGQKDLALPVPVETVTRRLFSAADDSNFEIFHKGENIGFCRWSPQTISALRSNAATRAPMPEGMVDNITGYSMSLDGTLMLDSIERLRFNLSLDLDTNFVWQSLRSRLALDEYQIQASVNAQDRSAQLSTIQGQTTKSKTYSFADLQDRGKVMAGLGGGMFAPIMGALGVTPSDILSGGKSLGLEWKAYTDHHLLGHTPIPVYVIQAELLEEYRLRAVVLPSGELLRIEIPGDVLLVNHKLNSM